MAPRRALVALLLAATACGQWSRVGRPEQNDQTDRLPQLIDPSAAYREMGLLTDNGPLGFVGTTRVFAGASQDSLLVVLGLSLRARGLTFRRDGESFLAEYRVEAVLRSGTSIAAQSSRNERVRVSTFRETQRVDESVIYQDMMTVGPGSYTLSVIVRDRNGPNVGRVEQAFVVPFMRQPSLTLPLAVYEFTPRQRLDAPPAIVLNPRQAGQYGSDTLRFYVESYGMPESDRIVASAVNGEGRVHWSDTLRTGAPQAVSSIQLLVPPDQLSIGRYELRLTRGNDVLATAPFVVTFSDQFAVANLEDIVSLLRYFPNADSLRGILRMPENERGAAWQRFWRQSDPVPTTPEHEAIETYLAAVRVANDRFRDEGVAGWLTERGEVLIRLGEPNDIVDRNPDQVRGRLISWNYYEHRLTLTFIDDAGFGRFRLDPRSRAEYIRVLNRITGR